MRDKNREEILSREEPVEVYPGVYVVQLNGRRDELSIKQLAGQLTELGAERQSLAIVVNISGTPAASAGTVRSLVGSLGPAKNLGARMILTGVHPPVARELAGKSIDISGYTVCSSLVAGLWTALDILETEAAAIEAGGPDDSL